MPPFQRGGRGGRAWALAAVTRVTWIGGSDIYGDGRNGRSGWCSNRAGYRSGLAFTSAHQPGPEPPTEGAAEGQVRAQGQGQEGCRGQLQLEEGVIGRQQEERLHRDRPGDGSHAERFRGPTRDHGHEHGAEGCTIREVVEPSHVRPSIVGNIGRLF